MTPEQTPYSLAQMVASQLAATYLHTLLLQEYCSAKEGVRRGLRRSKTHQVCFISIKLGVARSHCDEDMPEKEATYIITNGGINDPEKL